MPIMLATYSIHKIIVLKRYVSERRKNIDQTNTALDYTANNGRSLISPAYIYACLHSKRTLR